MRKYTYGHVAHKEQFAATSVTKAQRLQEIPLDSIWFTSLAKDSSHSSNLKVKTLRITYRSEISSLSVFDPGINIKNVN
jgi:hypothetical protein